LALCDPHSGLASSIEPRILLLIVVILILALALIVVSVSRVRTISRTVHIEERIQRIEDMGTQNLYLIGVVKMMGCESVNQWCTPSARRSHSCSFV
jgi:hypothetical protein